MRLAEALEKGDHVYIVLTMPVIYEHHGIYVGGNKVLHFCQEIVESPLSEFSNEKVVRKAPDLYVNGIAVVGERFSPNGVC